MRYLALGDSISIDDYTGVQGGGAASQFARRLGADEVLDLTGDGRVTTEVLNDLSMVTVNPDVVTLTVGGNDLLLGYPASTILHTLEQIGQSLARFNAIVILNTVYDPTDGDDNVAKDIGLPLELRAHLRAVNLGIAALAGRYGFILCDLETLFSGHGLQSAASWFVAIIEPNYEGACAISSRWLRLYQIAAAVENIGLAASQS